MGTSVRFETNANPATKHLDFGRTRLAVQCVPLRIKVSSARRCRGVASARPGRRPHLAFIAASTQPCFLGGSPRASVGGAPPFKAARQRPPQMLGFSPGRSFGLPQHLYAPYVAAQYAAPAQHTLSLPFPQNSPSFSLTKGYALRIVSSG